MLYNKKEYIQRRRDLRKNQTKPEQVVWNMLRNRQLDGYKFFRQYSVGPYILDFYSPKLRLAIEIDGSQHAELRNMEYDVFRTEYLAANNIFEIRFWNNEILDNSEGVYTVISESINRLIQQLPPLRIRGGRGS